MVILMLTVSAFLLTPLFAIPFATLGSAVAAAAPERGTMPAVSGEWGYPLAGDYLKGRGFGYNPVVGCSYCSTDHQGYDMAQGCGSTVFAAGPGRVITAGAYQGYGNAVRIDHGDGLVTLYGHMQWDSLRAAVGDSVTAGTPLGAEGNTGKSFGCHLHFEVISNGISVDPQPFMASRGLPLI
ncbi:M23 family metallopeptidase [Microbacterium sulfonylureivorans]|uniref:M23 family metallopeptidase n=1 Tax=Microbacterium sulfonylureivorans TaxID=2486854 RepID=UPI0013E0DC4C|nr:M23 family metallopeptidase [Microbacterium sulfonylureivorans]